MNKYSLIGILMRLITISLFVFYSIPKQIKEVRRHKNDFTRLRWIILIALVAYCLTSIPSIGYQATRLFEGQQDLTLQNFVTITSNIANLIVGIMVTAIYRYNSKGK